MQKASKKLLAFLAFLFYFYLEVKFRTKHFKKLKIELRMDEKVLEEKISEEELRERAQAAFSSKKIPKEISFIKCQFTDMQGGIREVTTSKEALARGYTSVDGSSAFGKIVPPTESDLILVPDWETFTQIPWLNNTARVICDVYKPNLEPFAGCSRTILKKVEKMMEKTLENRVKEIYQNKITKYHAHFAPEVEFLLLPESYDIINLLTDSTIKNNHYFIQPSTVIDEILKEIMNNLEKMGIKRAKYHTEVATYQYEIVMEYGNALRIADATMTLKSLIKEVAKLHKHKASFIPKFKEDVNGSGMHLHQSLAVTINGTIYNLFYDYEKKQLSSIAKQYIAGILKHAKEITAITNPLPISYKRLVPGYEAPTVISWDYENRTALCKVSCNENQTRVEYRSPDPSCNPYLCIAAILAAGLSGIEARLELGECEKKDYYHEEKAEMLPRNLHEALEYMNRSIMLRKWLGDFIIDSLYKLGINEWKEYSKKVSNIDLERYF